MPRRPPHPCAATGCSALVVEGPRCPKHGQQRQQSYERRRGSAHSRGYDRRWARYAKAFLAAHPLCEVYCKQEGRITAAGCVDHIVPHKGDMTRFWDPNNHQAACLKCNSRKNVEQEGGFGR